MSNSLFNSWCNAILITSIVLTPTHTYSTYIAFGAICWIFASKTNIRRWRVCLKNTCVVKLILYLYVLRNRELYSVFMIIVSVGYLLILECYNWFTCGSSGTNQLMPINLLVNDYSARDSVRDTIHIRVHHTDDNEWLLCWLIVTSFYDWRNYYGCLVRTDNGVRTFVMYHSLAYHMHRPNFLM